MHLKELPNLAYGLQAANIVYFYLMRQEKSFFFGKISYNIDNQIVVNADISGYLKFDEMAGLLFFSYLCAKFKLKNMIQQITDEQFDSVVMNSEIPVVVDFSATWCGPCRALEPIMQELSNEYEGKVKIVKCDVEECGDAAARFGVMNIPFLAFIKKGELVNSNLGAAPKRVIAEKIDQLVG